MFLCPYLVKQLFRLLTKIASIPPLLLSLPLTVFICIDTDLHNISMMSWQTTKDLQYRVQKNDMQQRLILLLTALLICKSSTVNSRDGTSSFLTTCCFLRPFPGGQWMCVASLEGDIFCEGGLCSCAVDGVCGVEAAENAEPMLIRPVQQ